MTPMRILTPSTAAEAGITRSQLQGPRFRRVLQGVYVDAHVAPTLPVLVAAARVAVPHSVVTGVTALRLRGGSPGTDSPIWLATDSRVKRAGIVTVPGVPSHERQGPSDEAVATLVRTLEHADLRLIDEVVTLDELRRKGTLTRREAEELAVMRPHTWQWSVPNSGSVRESRTRLVLLTAGLPEPELQFVVRTTDGRRVGRVDCAWPEYMVVLEYEGLQHLTDTSQWDSDIRRYESLERLGWTVVRVTSAGLRQPAVLVRRVEEALRAGGWRGRAPHLGAGWLGRGLTCRSCAHAGIAGARAGCACIPCTHARTAGLATSTGKRGLGPQGSVRREPLPHHQTTDEGRPTEVERPSSEFTRGIGLSERRRRSRCPRAEPRPPNPYRSRSRRGRSSSCRPWPWPRRWARPECCGNGRDRCRPGSACPG